MSIAFSETTETIAYGLLSSRVSQLLGNNRSDSKLDDEAVRVLREGLDLISNFVSEL